MHIVTLVTHINIPSFTHYSETPNRYFLNKQPHLANKSCAKHSPYKLCPRLPFLKRKKNCTFCEFPFPFKVSF